ncbi:hypothetical protein ACSFA0_19775 [Variovorax sp. LT1P1]
MDARPRRPHLPFGFGLIRFTLLGAQRLQKDEVNVCLVMFGPSEKGP